VPAVFTVFFEGPFWVGILESKEGDELSVARHVFGAEPSNPELLEFMLHRYAHMPRFRSREAGVASAVGGRANPKRALRESRRAQERTASTKSQAALSSALEVRKAGQSAISRERRRDEAERRFVLRAEKRRRRHCGH